MALPRLLLAAAFLATTALAPTADAHLIEDGRKCGDQVFYTSPAWIQAWAADPIDEDNMTNDHRFNSIGRADYPCVSFHWPCLSHDTWCPLP